MNANVVSELILEVFSLLVHHLEGRRKAISICDNDPLETTKTSMYVCVFVCVCMCVSVCLNNISMQYNFGIIYV